eukprot:7383804-Prymnesium_polylepis.1
MHSDRVRSDSPAPLGHSEQRPVTSSRKWLGSTHIWHLRACGRDECAEAGQVARAAKQFDERRRHTQDPQTQRHTGLRFRLQDRQLHSCSHFQMSRCCLVHTAGWSEHTEKAAKTHPEGLEC